MIILSDKLPVSLAQFEINLDAITDHYNNISTFGSVKIKKFNIKNIAIELIFLQESVFPPFDGFCEIGTIQAILIKDGEIFVRSAINWMENSFPGFYFFSYLIRKMHEFWNIQFVDGLVKYDGHDDPVVLIANEIEQKYNAKYLPGYYQRTFDAKYVKSLNIGPYDPIGGEKLARWEAEIIASGSQINIHSYKRMMQDIEKKLPILSSIEDQKEEKINKISNTEKQIDEFGNKLSKVEKRLSEIINEISNHKKTTQNNVQSTKGKRGPSERRVKRINHFKSIKDAYPEYGRKRVAEKAFEEARQVIYNELELENNDWTAKELDEEMKRKFDEDWGKDYFTEHDVRNDYRDFGWKWKIGSNKNNI